MFELVYSLFFVILILQVIVFAFLNLPTPRGWKAVIIKFVQNNPKIKTILQAQLALCLIAGLFYVDCYRQQNRFHEQKQSVKAKDSLGSQLKYSFLSFMTLKTQRNKYITFMMIYAALALMAYVKILNYMYEKRQLYEKNKLQQQKSKVNNENKQQKNPYLEKAK